LENIGEGLIHACISSKHVYICIAGLNRRAGHAGP
jgi:hypothetical protein